MLVTGIVVRPSIHALHTERDHYSCVSLCFTLTFNPRAPHGARRLFPSSSGQPSILQSTRSTRSATTKSSTVPPRPQPLQSTRSTRSATSAVRVRRWRGRPSIHALHTERDKAAAQRSRRTTPFNPRAPHGARRAFAVSVVTDMPLQSTRSTRSATSRYDSSSTV